MIEIDGLHYIMRFMIKLEPEQRISLLNAVDKVICRKCGFLYVDGDCPNRMENNG